MESTQTTDKDTSESQLFNQLIVQSQNFSSVSEFLNYDATWGNFPSKKAIFFAIKSCLLWNLWLARNDRIFKKQRSSFTKVADSTISLSYSWCKHRGKTECGTWGSWCCSPVVQT
ncbi:hypothetical protein LXL04_022024 [Taraxacum kok-saghyz]